MPIISDASSTTLPEKFAPGNFHQTFLTFLEKANDKSKGNVLRHEGLKSVILKMLDSYRANDSKDNPYFDKDRVGNESITFKEFGILRKEFGLPFADAELGYYYRNKGTAICGQTLQSPEVSLDDYVNDLELQITLAARFTSEDPAKEGITEKALKIYCDRRNKKGPIEAELKGWWMGTYKSDKHFDVVDGEALLQPCPRGRF
jgi:hypothetical protein